MSSGTAGFRCPVCKGWYYTEYHACGGPVTWPPDNGIDSIAELPPTTVKLETPLTIERLIRALNSIETTDGYTRRFKELLIEALDKAEAGDES